MPYSSEFYLDLFEKTFLETETPEERIEALRHGDVYRYRVKTYRAGKVLECEIFPLWNTQGEASRAKKAKESRPAQQKLNDTNTQKKIARLSNNNFTGADVWATFGYDDDNLPATPEQAQKDIVNYFRRIKRERAKQGLPPIRYIYVTEWQEADAEDEAIRVHHHVIMSGDMDRDYLEGQWHGGNYPQARRLMPKDCGITGLAYYMAGRGKKCKRMWAYSTNLKMPAPSVADKKITPRQAEKIALDRNAAPALFEKIFKGYKFQDTERDLQIKHSDFVAGAYIYVQMHQIPTPTKRAKKKPAKEK